jgi:uroporphyrinogen III methyltransferase/synthase
MGRYVAVTRVKSGEDELTARLLDLGARVLEAPAIAIAPPESFDELDAALDDLDSVSLMAFTSGNAVECTVARAEALSIRAEALSRPQLAAVGAVTAARVRRLIRPPDFFPQDARAGALGALLAGEVRGKKVLVPRAEEGRPELVEALTQAGAQVVAPVAYRTVAASPEALQPLASALGARRLDAVTFASPSAVRSVVDALGTRSAMLSGVVLGALGPTTAAELRALGFQVGVQPNQSSGVALANALAEQLGPRA